MSFKIIPGKVFNRINPIVLGIETKDTIKIGSKIYYNDKYLGTVTGLEVERRLVDEFTGKGCIVIKSKELILSDEFPEDGTYTIK